jgi:hypothetical protein
MQPLDSVQSLIDKGQITEPQWNLYVLASEHLDNPEGGNRSVTLRIGDQEVIARRVGFDVELPGVLVVEGGNRRKSYWAWSELFGVIPHG